MQYDNIAARIEAFDDANADGGGSKDKGAYHLYLLETEAPIARLKPTGNGGEVRIGYWSHRRKWENVDDMGGVFLPLDDALEFIANEGIFWTRTLPKNVQSRAESPPARRPHPMSRSG